MLLVVHGFRVGLLLDSAVMDLGRFYGTEGLSGGVPAACGRSGRGGAPVAQVAAELGISDQSIYTWRRQARIAAGVEAGLTTAEKAELGGAAQASARARVRVGDPPAGDGVAEVRWRLKKSSRPSE